LPCKDVTEVIHVVLDGDDRLIDYAFQKRTCGQGVGTAALLAGHLHGQPADAVLALEPGDIDPGDPGGDDAEVLEFLALKHLFAVQSVLEVYTGRAAGRASDACAAAEISVDGGEVHIRATLSVDVITDRIRSCGGCKGCGRNKKVAIKL
jgi:hypothetical protein